MRAPGADLHLSCGTEVHPPSIPAGPPPCQGPPGGWGAGDTERAGAHHGEQAERMVAPRCGVGHGLVPKVLELLLRLVKHLHALRVLVLQLAQLHDTGKARTVRAALCLQVHTKGPSRLSSPSRWGVLLASETSQGLTRN